MSNFYVCYSDEAKDDLRNIFMYIAYNLGSRDNAEGQVNRVRDIARHFLISAPLQNGLSHAELSAQ